jgi:hypothetical protein
MKHIGHAHPNTTSARTACRKAQDPKVMFPYLNVADPTPVVAVTPEPLVSIGDTVIARMPAVLEPNYIKGTHCQACGSQDWDDIMTGSDPDLQGYSRCCNERVVVGRLGECHADNCYHA